MWPPRWGRLPRPCGGERKQGSAPQGHVALTLHTSRPPSPPLGYATAPPIRANGAVARGGEAEAVRRCRAWPGPGRGGCRGPDRRGRPDTAGSLSYWARLPDMRLRRDGVHRRYGRHAADLRDALRPARPDRRHRRPHEPQPPRYAGPSSSSKPRPSCAYGATAASTRTTPPSARPSKTSPPPRWSRAATLSTSSTTTSPTACRCFPSPHRTAPLRCHCRTDTRHGQSGDISCPNPRASRGSGTASVNR